MREYENPRQFSNYNNWGGRERLYPGRMSLNGRERPTYPAGRTQARPQVYQYYQPRSYQGGRGRGNWQARGNPSSARGRTSQRSGRPPWQQSPRPPGSWQQSRQTQSDGFYTDQDETDQVDANANQHQTDQTDETFHTESMEPSYDEEAELITGRLGDYDFIFGRRYMRRYGIDLLFSEKIIQWNGMRKLMQPKGHWTPEQIK